MTPTELLAVYDSQLRTDAETPSAVSVTALGPLRLVSFARGRGFVTYGRCPRSATSSGSPAGTTRRPVFTRR